MRLTLAILKLSMKNIWAHKMRSFLTVLGINIGVAAVISMMALGAGAKDAVTSQIRGFGTNTMTLRPDYREEGGSASANFEKLTVDDCRALVEQVPQIKAVSPELSRGVQVKYAGRNLRTNMQAVAPTYIPMRNFTIEAGRIFTPNEVEYKRRVAILGHKLVKELFNNDPHSAIGESIKIQGSSYTIVGTLAEKGDQGWSNPDDNVMIPYTTAMRRVFGTTNVHMISLQIHDEKEVEAAIRGVTRVMRQRHRLTPQKADDFVVFSSTDALKSFENMGQIFTLLLGGIAGISLLVGGIGIMNIMLVTVTERTREIGIRKALGAKRRHILQQFLIEAMVISIIGGTVGVGAGSSMAWLASLSPMIKTKISPFSIILSLTVCLFIGVFFGIVPAIKASRLDPIEALRYE